MRIYICFVLLLFFVSCKKETLKTYDEGNGIYFSTQNIYLDTLEVPWGLKRTDLKNQTITLEVLLFGNVANYDRPFDVTVVHDASDSLEAEEFVDYQPLKKQYFIPAGEASTVIEVELMRNPVLKQESRHITIRLEKSEELGFLYSRKKVDSNNVVRYLDYQRVIRMTENFPRPNWWSYYGNDYFGTWSVKKSILVCDLMGIDREVWMTTPNFSEDFTEGFIKYAGVYVHRWLQDQDPQILDEDGRPMEMGRKSKR